MLSATAFKSDLTKFCLNNAACHWAMGRPSATKPLSCVRAGNVLGEGSWSVLHREGEPEALVQSSVRHGFRIRFDEILLQWCCVPTRRGVTSRYRTAMLGE